jgi:hypothetical protein
MIELDSLFDAEKNSISSVAIALYSAEIRRIFSLSLSSSGSVAVFGGAAIHFRFHFRSRPHSLFLSHSIRLAHSSAFQSSAICLLPFF